MFEGKNLSESSFKDEAITLLNEDIHVNNEKDLP